MEVTAGA